MRYTETHEWVELHADIATVGISNFAQCELGDIVYVELPQIDKKVKAGEQVCVLESTKSAADVYSPVSGIVVEVNEKLTDQVELINREAQGQGWLFKIKIEKADELASLMDEEAYKAMTG